MTSKSGRGCSNASATLDTRNTRLFLSGPGSMIWTTTSSSSYGATLANGINTSLPSSNNSQVHSNHHQHNLPAGANNNSSNINSSNKSSPLVPLINGSHDHNSTRIDNHHAFNHFKTLGHRNHLSLKGISANSQALINVNSAGANVVTTPTGAGHLQMMARDRKPLTPEYEVPGPLTSSDVHLMSHQPFQTQTHLPPNPTTANHFPVHSQQQQLQHQHHQHQHQHPHQQHNNVMINTNTTSFHHQLHPQQQTPSSSSNGSSRDGLNYNVTDSLEEGDLLGSASNLPPLVRGVNLAATIAEQFENKSNHSESHIYSHIYDPSSSCGCPSCDRLSATPTTMMSGHNDGCMSTTTVLTTCRRNGQGVTSTGLNLNLAGVLGGGSSSGGSNVTTATAMSSTGPLYHALSPVSSVLSTSRATQLSPYHIFLSQNHWNGCDPISLQGKKKKSHSHASASISHSSSSSSLTSKLSKCGAFLTSAPCIRRGQRDRTLDLDPITAELEKRRRRRCLILSTLFTLAIILGIFLVTSFVMFVISSYQSYYGTSSPGSVVVTQPQSDTASLSVTGMSVNAAVVPTSSLPFFNDSNNSVRQPTWIESTAAANYDNSVASITPPATSVLVTHHATSSSSSSASSPSSSSTNFGPRLSNHTRQHLGGAPLHQTVAPSPSKNDEGEDEEPACLEGEEWKCADGLCIPREKRCDGHFNCYDHSDENNCNPCPLSEGYFHCGNETSCLDPSKRCNGVFDCWDGSDEHLCIPGCDPETEFTCSPSGRCIEKGQFCDGVNDCEDDEPVGCSTLAPGPKVII